MQPSANDGRLFYDTQSCNCNHFILEAWIVTGLTVRFNYDHHVTDTIQLRYLDASWCNPSIFLHYVLTSTIDEALSEGLFTV